MQGLQTSPNTGVPEAVNSARGGGVVVPMASSKGIVTHYYLPPTDSKEINYWMFAMIGIGTSFIIFVVVSIYLVW